MKLKSFIKKEVADLLNMKPGTVAFYTNEGFVKPEAYKGKGRGSTRRYSYKNLVEFLLILELSKHGLSHLKIKKVLNAADEAPLKQYKKVMGKNYTTGFNLFDCLNFDDPIIKISEVFIIIYDDDKNLSVEFRVLGGKKTDDELAKLSREEIKNELKKFVLFRIDMNEHDSAIVINVSKLWREVMKI